MAKHRSDPRPAHIPDIRKDVTKALKQLDHRLYPLYWSVMKDPRDGIPIHKGEDGPAIPHERWYVFRDCEDGTQMCLFAVEREWTDIATGRRMGEFQVPSMVNTVDRIMGDLARRMSPDEISDFLEEREGNVKERRNALYDDLREDEFKENKTIIKELMDTPAALNHGVEENKRDSKIFSYPGQSNRGTHNESIKRTADDIGWVKPDYKKELDGN